MMTLVFEHYPGTAGEMLLALAIADHAHDDGSNVFPSVPSLAQKSRQSERTVQRQLRSMEVSGWLQCVQRSEGGRNKASRYRINPSWIDEPKAFEFGKVSEAINGDTVSPFEPPKRCHGVTVSGSNPSPETVTSTTRNGDTAVSPAYNHHRTIKPPVVPHESPKPDDAADRELAGWMFERLQALNPGHREPNWRRWCRELRMMRERDRRTAAQMRELFAWANADPFWSGNILSPGKLREKWDQLVLQRSRGGRGVVTTSTALPDTQCAHRHPSGGRCMGAGVRAIGPAWFCRAHFDIAERAAEASVNARTGGAAHGSRV